MRILVAGAGAIGSAVGARLASAGHRVALLGRGAYVARVRAQGLIVRWPARRDRFTDLPVGDAVGPLVETLGGLDLVIVSTKVHDTGGACRMVREAVEAAGATVLLLQNGVGGDPIAAGALPGAPLVSGVITWVVSTVAPGEYVVRNRRRGVGLAPFVAPAGSGEDRAPIPEDVGRWVRLFREAGVTCRAYDDARAIRWSKLLLNMLGNAIPAILDLPPSDVFADAGLYSLERAAFLEAVGVMRAAGIPVVDLPGYPVRRLVTLMERLPEQLSRPVMVRLIAGGRSGKAPSLMIDVRSGRGRSEVTALNGAVVRAGGRLGVSTPANAAITEALVRIVLREIPPSALARNPSALLARARMCGWRAS